MSEDNVREKERYEARERERERDVVRKQRERNAADIKARQESLHRLRRIESEFKLTCRIHCIIIMYIY